MGKGRNRRKKLAQGKIPRAWSQGAIKTRPSAHGTRPYNMSDFNGKISPDDLWLDRLFPGISGGVSDPKLATEMRLEMLRMLDGVEPELHISMLKAASLRILFFFTSRYDKCFFVRQTPKEVNKSEVYFSRDYAMLQYHNDLVKWVDTWRIGTLL